MAYFPTISGTVSTFSDGVVSTLNTTSTPLGANVAWTGTGELISGYAAIGVTTAISPTTASGLITYKFSPDGSNWVVGSGARQIQIPITSVNAASDFHNFIPTSPYFRVEYQNYSTVQTTFNLQTMYNKGARVALPTSRLTQTITGYSDVLNTRATLFGKTEGGDDYIDISADGEGHIEVRISEPVSTFGEIVNAEPTPTAQLDFVYGINANNVYSTLTGSGTVTASNQMGLASTNAFSGSSATILSQRTLKYNAGQAIQSRQTAVFSTGVAGSTQLAGIGNDGVDGWYVGYSGTQFGVMYRNNSVDTWVPQTSFSSDKLDGTGSSGFNINPLKMNIYKIDVGYLGTYGAVFSTVNPVNGQFVEFHKYLLTNTLDRPQSTNPTVRLKWEATNTTNTSNVVVKGASGGLFLLGKHEWLGGRYGVVNFKSISTTLTNVLTLKCNTTVNSIINTGQMNLESVSFTAVATNNTEPSILILTRNSTLGGSTAYVDVDSVNSCASWDISGTTISGGTQVFNTTVSGGGGQIDLKPYNLYLNPGDTMTFGAYHTAGAANNKVVTVNWTEDI